MTTKMPAPATSTAAAAAAGQAAIPPSLQQLIRDMEASDNRTVSTHLARKAKDLIADAISGSMCEEKLGRRIPLAEALQRSRVELTGAVNEYRDEFVKNPFRAMSGVDSTRVISKQMVENFFALDFTGFGYQDYADILGALIKIKWNTGGWSDEISVINEFCGSMSSLLSSVTQKIGHDIGKVRMSPSTTSSIAVAATSPVVAPATTFSHTGASGGIPPSLQQLVRKMEASNDPTVSTDLVRFANALFDAAFSGRMWEKQVGRKITLPEALQRCGLMLLSTYEEYINVMAKIRRVNMSLGIYDTPITSKIVVPIESIEKFVSLDFSGFGIAECEDIASAMVELRKKGGPLKDEIFVINNFCERYSKLLQSVKEKIGRDISATTAQAAGAAIPPSLQHLVREMEASDDPSVSTDLVRFANTLFDAAFNGSAKRVPLADALQRCSGEIISAVNEYNHTMSRPNPFVCMFGEGIGFDTPDNVSQKDIEDLVALDFTGFGIDQYDTIRLALQKLKGGPHKDEIIVVKQFCERMTKLLCSVKAKIGHDIAKPPTIMQRVCEQIVLNR